MAELVADIIRLPVELLLEVFKLATCDETEAVGARTAFQLSAVCHAWRAMLLSYGPAWGALSFANSEVTELMLVRSRTAPVVVRINLCGAPYGTCDRWALSARRALDVALGRTNTLSIASRRSQTALTLPLMTAFGGGGARTALEILELTVPDHDVSVYSLESGHLAVPIMPLKRLTLQCTTLVDESCYLLSAHCAMLVHLELLGVQGMSLSALLDTLTVARHTLKTIILQSITFSLSSTSMTPTPTTINLASLQTLTLEGLSSPISGVSSTPAALLSYIVYPLSTRLAIHIHLTHTAHFNSAAGQARAHLASRSLAFQSLLLSPIHTASRHSGLRLQCWNSRAVPDWFNLDQRAPAAFDLRITRTTDATDAFTMSTLAVLAEAANAHTVRRAAVAPLVSEWAWDSVLAAAPALIELSLYGPSVLTNLLVACESRGRATARSQAPGDSTEPTPGFLEKLSTLNVFGLDLVAPAPDSSPRNESQHEALVALLRVLPQKRKELCVCYCDVRARDMDLLAPFVAGGSVVWDGSEHGVRSAPCAMVPRGVPVMRFALGELSTVQTTD